MTFAELEAGLRSLGSQNYSEEFTAERRARFTEVSKQASVDSDVTKVGFRMSLKWIKLLFAASGVYDALLGLAFLLFGLQVFQFAGVTPPNHIGYIQFPAYAANPLRNHVFQIAAGSARRNRTVWHGIKVLLFRSGILASTSWRRSNALASLGLGGPCFLPALFCIWWYICAGHESVREAKNGLRILWGSGR